jgi:hypothetical protein
MEDLFIVDILVGTIVKIFMILTNIENAITLDAVGLVYLEVKTN